jgi:MFS superfamily sulfate permease-like transporter
MGTMISKHLDHDMDRVVPTTVVIVALVSSIVGVVFLTMGMLRATSIANCMPYPVIAGFLSGIGAKRMHNGIHVAAEEILTVRFFSWEQQWLAWPAILFAALVMAKRRCSSRRPGRPCDVCRATMSARRKI